MDRATKKFCCLTICLAMFISCFSLIVNESVITAADTMLFDGHFQGADLNQVPPTAYSVYNLTNASLDANGMYGNMVIAEPGQSSNKIVKTFDNTLSTKCIAMRKKFDYRNTLILHGNYENGLINWESSISDHSIPNSYYLLSKPAFLGSKNWTVHGSDTLSRGGTIPAEDRWVAMPNSDLPGTFIL